MMLSVLFVGIALFGACESRPGVHRFTSETVTRVHKLQGGGEVIHYETKYGGGDGGAAIDGGVHKHIKVDSTVDSDGSYYNSNTGVNRRRRCGRGLIDEAATDVNNVAQGVVGQAASIINDMTGNGTFLGPVGGIVDATGSAAKDILQHGTQGVNYAIQDAACGLGNIADAAAKALDDGDILGGVGTIGKEFFGGLGNMAEDLADEAAGGVGSAASGLFGFIGGLGK